MRAPAKIVSCPHCSWKGSARGLFTHCRMAHPHLPMPETKSIRVLESIHPQNTKKSYKIKDSKELFNWKVELITICLKAIVKAMEPQLAKKIGYVPRIDDTHLSEGFKRFRLEYNRQYWREAAKEKII